MIWIPCGLRIYDREIDLIIEFEDEYTGCDIFLKDKYIGNLARSPELDAAITAHVEYEKSIEDKSKD